MAQLAKRLSHNNTIYVLGGVVLGGMILATPFTPLLILALVGLTFGSIVVWFFVRRPWTVFGLYLFLLPPHIIVMSLLLVWVGLPANAVKAVAAWKELTLALLLVVALLQLVRRGRVVATVADGVVVLFLGYVGVFAGLEILERPDPLIFFYALRDMLLPIMLYFVGRSMLLSDTTAQHVFRWVLIAALLLSIIGIIERFFVPLEWHVLLGIPRYYREVQNVFFPDFLLGLPTNYWTSGNSGALRRAVSVYASSQLFALSYLFFLPICLYGVITPKLAEHRLAWVAFLVALVGVLITLTRFTIVVVVLLLLLLAVLGNQRSRLLVLILALLGVIGFISVLIVFEDVRWLLINTITFQDHSSSNRLIIWQATLDYIFKQPFGYGLGAAGLTAWRYGGGVVAIEGQYSAIGVVLGLVGLLIYIGLLATVSMYLLRAAYRIQAMYQRGLCFALALTVFGIAINSVTTEWHNNIGLTYPTWWLIGACVGYAARQEWRQRKGAMACV